MYEEDRLLEYDYKAFRTEVDLHNRCCGGILWCIRDICGVICAILTWFLILYAEFVVVNVILWPTQNSWYGIINMILFQCCAVLAFASHMRTMFTDPVSYYSYVAHVNCSKSLAKIVSF